MSFTIGAVFAYVGTLILNLPKVLPYTIVMIIIGIITFVFIEELMEI